MGFGHRVYKNHDPRARVLMSSAHEVLGELGIENEPLLEIAMELEKIALEDEYFVQRKLFPNVDFYSGIILKALGFPTSMFTVLFRRRADRRMDRAMEGNDRGPVAENRPAASTLYRPRESDLCSCRPAVGEPGAVLSPHRSSPFGPII